MKIAFARVAVPFVTMLAVACGDADPGDTNDTASAKGVHPTAGATPETAFPETASPETASPEAASPGTTSTTKAAELPRAAGEPGREANGAVIVAPLDPPPVNRPGNRFVGVNLNGAEFAYTVFPGVEGRDFGWPTHAEIDYFTGKGMNTFRIGFLWERMQTKAFGELTPSYVAKLDDLVAYATSHGANVILNPHNFARYYGAVVGSSAVPASAFADLWKRLASRYVGNARVMFNLVNEPHGLPTEQWVTAANGAIAAIRAAGATNLVHVPGNAWTGAHSWNQSWYGTSNAKAMLDVVDPADKMVFEVHQYLDATSGGKTGECVSRTIGSERLRSFIDWLREHGKKGFVGEFAGGNNNTCNAAVTDMLNTMEGADDVLVGWLWWAAGPRWNPNYPFSIEPKDGRDAPQLSLLTPYL